MSSPGSPSLPTTISITNDPAIDGLILKGLIAAATAGAGWAANHLHVTDPSFIAAIVAALVSVLGGFATLAWGWLNSRTSQARAVMAGINLQASGNGLMQPTFGGKKTPQPVTSATAQAIIRDFADVKVKVADEPKETDDLNIDSAKQSGA